MHGTLPSPARRRGFGVPLVLRLALRELRGGLKGFGIFLACIALGVAAIAGVTSISRSLTEGLTREGRKILGGDMAFSLMHREASPAELAFLQGRGQASAIATMRAMAMAGDKGSALVELKAVDGAYPTIGTLQTEPQLPTGDLFANRGACLQIAAEAHERPQAGLGVTPCRLLKPRSLRRVEGGEDFRGGRRYRRVLAGIAVIRRGRHQRHEAPVGFLGPSALVLILGVPGRDERVVLRDAKQGVDAGGFRRGRLMLRH